MFLKNYEIFIIIVIFLSSILFFLLIGIFVGQVIAKQKFKNTIKDIRKDAVQRSKSVIIGQFTEQIAPFFPDFPYNPKDLRFVGNPVDFIVFEGITTGKIKEVVFLEIKTGKSNLNTNERSLKNIIENKKVSYKEYRHL